jgi:hypothetical protein
MFVETGGGPCRSLRWNDEGEDGGKNAGGEVKADEDPKLRRSARGELVQEHMRLTDGTDEL